MRFTISACLLILVACGLRAFAMDRTKCRDDIVEKLTNEALSYNNSIFFWDGQRYMSNHSNIALTIDGCRDQCGASYDWYPDIGPRLTTWLVPVVVLIGNMQFATLGKRHTIWTIMHLLGDPIDSIWSLLTKLGLWNRSYDLAEKLSSIGGLDQDHVRDRGTILASIHELLGPGSDPEQIYKDIIKHSTIDGNDLSRPALHHLCREIANELSDSSVNELPRTWLAILSYVFTVLAAFVEAIGGKGSSQPGGRIGTAMFISWLLPTVLLSNTVGGFISRRTCLRTMERFVKATKPAVQIDAWSGSASLSPRRSSVLSTPRSLRKESVPFSPSLSAANSPSVALLSAARRRAPSLPLTEITLPLTEMILPEPSLPIDEPDAVSGSQGGASTAATKPALSRVQPLAEYLDLQVFSKDRPSTWFGREKTQTPFDAAQPWSGAIYTYQPEKHLFSVEGKEDRERSRGALVILAIFPILIALTTAFLIIWFTPTSGLTCRHFPLIGIFAVWLFSCAFTSLSYRYMTGVYH